MTVLQDATRIEAVRNREEGFCHPSSLEIHHSQAYFRLG